jgi:hypothetical protein
MVSYSWSIQYSHQLRLGDINLYCSQFRRKGSPKSRYTDLCLEMPGLQEGPSVARRETSSLLSPLRKAQTPFTRIVKPWDLSPDLITCQRPCLPMPPRRGLGCHIWMGGGGTLGSQQVRLCKVHPTLLGVCQAPLLVLLEFFFNDCKWHIQLCTVTLCWWVGHWECVCPCVDCVGVFVVSPSCSL